MQSILWLPMHRARGSARSIASTLAVLVLASATFASAKVSARTTAEPVLIPTAAATAVSPTALPTAAPVAWWIASPVSPRSSSAPTTGANGAAQCHQTCFEHYTDELRDCSEECMKCVDWVLFICVARVLDQNCYGPCIRRARHTWQACVDACPG